jgi:cellobiose phosphorylase
MHQYSPLTKKGNKEGFGDDHLWLVQAVVNYIKETGDYGFLEEVVTYNDEKTEGTMYEHVVKAIEYSWNNTGYHGLTKAGNADWNDCLNLAGPKKMAVSVMVAEMFVFNANLLSGLAGKTGKKSDADRFKKMAEEMKQRINDKAWDGNWYLRAYDDDGTPVGTNANKEGKIWLETQTWAILSGVAEGERAIKTMDSVNKYLYTKYGIVLFYPAYSEYSEKLGYVSVFPRGLKENAAIFCHTNPWAMVAETLLGRGEQAFKYYKTILPTANNDIADIHWTEPYIYSQMIAGKEHRDFGQAKNSWLTGTAAWNFVAISQFILGVKPDYDGLIIDPCIPKTWKNYSVKRVFRGITYDINVKNPSKVNSGVKKMTVDKVEVKGNKVPLFDDGKEHVVEIILG